MNAVQAEARTRLHSWFTNAHREGVECWVLREGGERKGTYRKGKGRTYTSRGETEKCWAMFNSHYYLFTLVPVYDREAFAVLGATSSHQSSARLRCRQPPIPQRKADTVTQPLNFPSRHGTGEKSCCCCCCF